MSICRYLLVSTVWLSLWVVAAEAKAETGPTDAATLWADFNHYVRVARPDLAGASARMLLKVEPQKLLDVVESSEYRRDYQNTFELASRISELREVAAELERRIQEARLARSRDPQRIAEDIVKLAGGPRERLNATERLCAAGQFAVPQMLAALEDEERSALHPYLLEALVQVGQAAVPPLCAAVADLPARPMGQVAQVLADIGYPQAVPYLKQILEDPKTDPGVREKVARAYERLTGSNNLPKDLSAAQWFLRLGQNFYTAGTNPAGVARVPGFDAQKNEGILWEYRRQLGLIPVRVPAHIFADVLARRAAERALALDNSLEPALSLWLAANLRRELRLAGAADPSYPQAWQTPRYYLRMAGPMRQLDVLNRALDDNDVALAMEAVYALSETAGREALLKRSGASQPLIRAIFHPDRRLSFRAALALAAARPQETFTGADRVVRLLAQAIRPAQQRTAVVLASDQETANRLAATARELGLQVILGTNLEEINPQISLAAGVDLVIAGYPADLFEMLTRQMAGDYRLAALPVIAVAEAREAVEIERRFALQARKPYVVRPEDPAAVTKAIQEALAASGGVQLTEEETRENCLKAMAALRDLVISLNQTFRAVDAQPAVIQALGDRQPEIVAAAAEILALLDTAEAQTALADAALDSSRPQEQRIMLLGALADSARNHGNRLSQAHLDKILALVLSSEGELAIAASRVHGALNLPAANVVRVIAQP